MSDYRPCIDFGESHLLVFGLPSLDSFGDSSEVIMDMIGFVQHHTLSTVYQLVREHAYDVSEEWFDA